MDDTILNKYVPMTESSCYVLLSIVKDPKHGYAIMQDIKQMTNGTVTISNGTLYGVLTRMVEDGLIEVSLINDKKIYKATKLGKDILEVEKKRLILVLCYIEEAT